MTTLREAAQQALEALQWHYRQGHSNTLGGFRLKIDEKALRELSAALAQQDEPVQEQDVEDAIEAAYWHFDARKKGLNEWAYAPQSERDAFKAEARKLVRGYFPTRQAQDTKREMLAVADAFIRGKRAALAQQDEPVTEDMKSAVRWAPSSAYWSQRLRELFGPDAREGIDALERRLAEAQQDEPVEPVAWLIEYDNSEREVRFVAGTRGITQTPLYAAAPTAEPVAWMTDRKEMYFDKDDALRYSDSIIKPLYLAPPQRKPLTEEVATLIAQRDALLEALKDAAKTIEHLGYPLAAIERARAAIKAVEGTK